MQASACLHMLLNFLSFDLSAAINADANTSVNNQYRLIYQSGSVYFTVEDRTHRCHLISQTHKQEHQVWSDQDFFLT